MKKTMGILLSLVLTLICAAALADVEISETNFPDPNFRQYIIDIGWDSDGDGILKDDEISVLNYISCDNRGIKSLKGIEYFTGLEAIWCSNNQLTSLDVSKNTALKELIVDNNQLSNLDVSKNTSLTSLGCNKNQLTSLDVSENTSLTELYCHTNQITSLDVSKNTSLTKLYCHTNQITSLDVSKNTALTGLFCALNQLTSLDLSKNTALTELNCIRNLLSSLDLSKNTALTYLACQVNQLTSLDVSKNINLTKLYISVNDIKTLNVSRNKELSKLCTEFTDIKELDVSSCPNLCEAVKNYKRQTISATSGGWDFEGYYDAWKNEDGEVLSCNKTTKVIAGSIISEPSETTEPSVGDTFTSDGLKYKVTGKSTAVITGTKKAKSSVTIPATVSYLGKTFKVTEIDTKAFYKDAKITTVTVGKNIKTIGKSAFEGCKKLKTVKGGAAVADIKESAFKGCVKLENLTLEKNVKAIGKNAFNGDKALKIITVKTTKLATGSIKSGAFKGINSKATFKCPKNKVDSYKKLFIKAGAPKTCKFK